MEHRMRDLDQIQERDPDGAGRRLGTIIMATIAFVGLSAAIGVVLGRAARPEQAEEDLDPLSALDQASPARARADLSNGPRSPKVEAAALSFPNTLTEQEDRPEVLAALAAAAVEEAALADEPLPSSPTLANATTAGALVERDAQLERPIDELEEEAIERMPAAMPASVNAGPAQRALATAVKHDPLVEASIPSAPNERDSAPRGEEGEFTLQVISYDNREAAERFAQGLRAKGHQAFVMEAEIPERGTYYRVRIGPFKWRYKANRYRRDFEATEHMNTYVVRRPRDA